MERERMDRLLFEASVDGNLTALQMLLQEYPLILDRVSLNHHDDMPLHIASMLGHIDFVKEILTRKPELATECDSQRRLPLHVASAKGHVQIVKALVSANPETCLAHDRDGLNPLHLAAIRGRYEVVKELVHAQPHAARAMVQHETILHLCVKYNQQEALKFLVETMADHEFVNSKDADGNTILHLAVADKQIETINFLLLDTSIEVDASNANGHTASDILAQGPRDSKKDVQIIQSLMRAGATEKKRNVSFGQAPKSSRSHTVLDWFKYLYKTRHLRKDLRNLDNWLDKKQNALMIVASLIATMAFQAGTNPPGGVWQEDQYNDPVTNDTLPYPNIAGHAVMANKHGDLYRMFLVCNTLGFVSTLSIILLLISELPILQHRTFMRIMMVIMWIATTSMSLTYYVSISVLTPGSMGTTAWVVPIVIVFVSIGLMTLLLVGHTIRLVLKAKKKFKEQQQEQDTRRAISAPTVKNHA